MPMTFEQLRAQIESPEFEEERKKEQEERERKGDEYYEGLANLVENNLPGCHYGHNKGAVAQLGERDVRIVEAIGSIPISSNL